MIVLLLLLVRWHRKWYYYIFRYLPLLHRRFLFTTLLEIFAYHFLYRLHFLLQLLVHFVCFRQQLQQLLDVSQDSCFGSGQVQRDEKGYKTHKQETIKFDLFLPHDIFAQLYDQGLNDFLNILSKNIRNYWGPFFKLFSVLFRFCVFRVNFELYLCVVVKIEETVILGFEAFQAFEPFFVELFDSEHGALRAMGDLFQVSEDPEEGKTDFVDL